MIKTSPLEPDDVTVDNGEATVILEVDSVGGCSRWYRPSSDSLHTESLAE